MKVSLPTQILLEGVGHGAAVAASKSPKPILECVALHADSTTGASLEATDLDVGIRFHLQDASVSEEGALVVPASRLLSIVREVDEDETTLVDLEGSLAVDTGRSHFRVRGESVEEFARLPYFPEGSATRVPADLLRSMIRRTVFAAAREAGRFALHGVLLTISGKKIEMVATDGRRLARCEGQLESKAARDIRVIVGPKGLSLLERVLGSSASQAAPPEVLIAVEERQALFRCGDALIISRLIDGTFPAYESVIPKESAHTVTCTVADLISGLRRAALLTTRDALSVELLIDGDRVTIKSRAMDVGEAKIEVPVTYDGPPTRLGFNPGFLLDALKVMDPASEVRFSFSGGKDPGTMTDSEDYIYVISPIALE